MFSFYGLSSKGEGELMVYAHGIRMGATLISRRMYAMLSLLILS